MCYFFILDVDYCKEVTPLTFFLIENPQMFRKLETKCYFCIKTIVSMTTFQLALLEEAKIFLEKISPQARKKILYNIWRVAGGERNSELFKKLENSEVWEFRTLYNL